MGSWENKAASFVGREKLNNGSERIKRVDALGLAVKKERCGS
jgi:hypothetical protein